MLHLSAGELKDLKAKSSTIPFSVPPSLLDYVEEELHDDPEFQIGFLNACHLTLKLINSVSSIESLRNTILTLELSVAKSLHPDYLDILQQIEDDPDILDNVDTSSVDLELKGEEKEEKENVKS